MELKVQIKVQWNALNRLKIQINYKLDIEKSLFNNWQIEKIRSQLQKPKGI